MWITFLIIGVFFCGLLLVGYLSSKKNTNTEDYFVAGRKLNKWTAANTMAATAIGSGTTIGVCTMAYNSGIAASWILIGYSLGFVLIALLIGKKIYNLNVLTLTDVIGSKYNQQVRNLTTILVLISYVGIACAQFIALGHIVSVLLDMEFKLAVILCGVIIIIYTTMGGLNALSITDSYQLIINLIGIMIILPIFGFTATHGFRDIVATVPEGFFSMGNYGLATTIGFFSWIIPQAFLSQELWVRIFACKDEKLAVQSTVIASVGIYLPYAVSVVSVGLIAATVLPAGLEGDAVLPTLISQLGNPVIEGILLAGLIAAVMSCADSVLLVSSSNLVHDFWGRTLGKKVKNDLKASRIGVVLIGVLAIILAMYAQNIISIMQMMATPFVGAIFPIVLAMFFWKKVTNTGAVATIIIALVMAVLFYLAKISVFGLDPSFVTVVVCTFTLIIVSLFTQNKKSEVA
nr:sodium:solute symporter family protein [uncultured Sphaerochaeta sp.]